MDLLLNTLTEWLKELLAGAIASNLTGMVDSVNTKVGDIAAQVGQTPQGWNGGIFHMIQNLSSVHCPFWLRRLRRCACESDGVACA